MTIDDRYYSKVINSPIGEQTLQRCHTKSQTKKTICWPTCPKLFNNTDLFLELRV